MLIDLNRAEAEFLRVILGSIKGDTVHDGAKRQQAHELRLRILHLEETMTLEDKLEKMRHQLIRVED